MQNNPTPERINRADAMAGRGVDTFIRLRGTRRLSAMRPVAPVDWMLR